MMANRKLKTITNVHLFILVLICVGFASGEDLKHRYPKCKDPVGMASGEIDDSLITASSFLDSAQSPARARLGFQGAWTARASDSNAWIQVSFPIPITITAVATQGHSNSSQWVKTYILEYSPDDTGHFVKYEYGLELTGNSDQKTTQTNVLGLPLKATRFIRIVPKSWEANISLRFELYGCKQALVGFEKTFLSVSENAGKTPVCVLMQGLVRESVIVKFTSDSNAMQSPSSVTFAANQTQTCFDLIIQDNIKVEHNKTAHLILSVDHPLLSVKETQKQLKVLILNDNKGKANLAEQKPGQLNDEGTESLLLTVIAIAGSFFGIAFTVGIILLLIRLRDKKKKRNDGSEES